MACMGHNCFEFGGFRFDVSRHTLTRDGVTKAFRDRSWYMTWLKMVLVLDVLRSAPRFAELSRRVGFVP